MVTKELKQKTLNLKPVDKIHLVEIILDSLNKPDKEIEKAWIKESEERYVAYKKGEIKAVGYDTVKKKFGR
ncbi:addiction module protein [bacterium]|jgi:putative addiction module component (TIGR02574 family)|nr:addiction module protein [bacterium]MBT3581418.1 addiction module protein [bacterium]MBT4552542.1 addiction module protein [bacterium]